MKLINNKKKTNKKNIKLIDAIENKELKDELKSNSEIIIHFSDFIKNEEDFLTNQIELNEGIGKNSLLKENIFLIFTTINCLFMINKIFKNILLYKFTIKLFNIPW